MTRLLFERVCRGVALSALVVAIWVSIRAASPSSAAPQQRVWRVADSLLADTSGGGVAALRELFDGAGTDTTVVPFPLVPAAPVRAALAAVQAAGVPLRWIDSARASGLAVSVTRTPAPGAPLALRVSGSADTSLVVRDAGGVLDSLARGADALSWQLGSATPPVAVQQGGSIARAAVPDSTASKRVLVAAQPGWEGKFVVAALEELGWKVDGTMRVSPSGAVTVGAPQRLALEQYAAVVVLDSMAVDAAALQAFVARGGAVVMGGDALRIPALAALSPVRTTELRGAIAGALLTDAPRGGLEAWELEVLSGSVVLQEDASDHGHNEPALVARRSGRGRVVAMPYRETWRWRMQGSDDGAAEHRRWWQTALVAAVPDATADTAVRRGLRDALPGEAAPYADLVARLGSADRGARSVSVSALNATRASAKPGSDMRSNLLRIFSAPALLLLAVLSLLAEWSSRRLRGQR